MMLQAWEDFSLQLTPIVLHEIPESGNGTPDYLNEIHWELQWLLKMKGPNGGVSEQITTRAFPDLMVMPEDDADTRYFLPWSSTATAAFAAVMAKAARIYAPFDAVFSAQCHDAAVAAADLLAITPGDDYMRPPGFDAGDYWYEHARARQRMYAELWETTGIAG